MSKEIKLKKLTLINFKGIKRKEIVFDSETNILGKNGSGKTSLFDAYTWVLFGKDSSGKTDFGLKTNDSNGNTISKLEHIVEATLLVNDELIVIRRTLKEKWVKTRGSLEAEFSGNKTEYLWNEVPKSQKEFQESVNNLLEENLFKLLTNPLAFNDLNWKDQRNILIEIVGHIAPEEYVNGNKDFESLSKMSNKELADHKSKISFQLKKLKDEIKGIPTRIDEVYRNTPEKLDYTTLEEKKKEVLISIENIEDQISDKSKAYEEQLDEKNKLSKKVFDYKQKKSKIEFDVKSQVDNEFPDQSNKTDKLKTTISEKESSLESNKIAFKSLENKLATLKTRSSNLKEEMDAKRNLWEEENAKELKFDNNSFVCPSCKRNLDQENIEEEKAKMLQDFKQDQSNTLLRIQKEGIALNKEKEGVDKEIIDIESSVKKGEGVITDAEIELVELNQKLKSAEKENNEPIDKAEIIKKRLASNEEYNNATTEINRLNELISKEVTIDNDKLKEDLKLAKSNLESIDKQLSTKSQIETSEKRIKELEKQESDLAQQISDKEKDEFIVDNFEKSKSNIIEARVNKMFKLAKFKLFESQINGGEVPTCKIYTNGVYFNDQNNALKINTGVDIINTLSKHYGVTAPIFIDNRESVTELVKSDSQIINLIVSPEHKELKVK